MTYTTYIRSFDGEIFHTSFDGTSWDEVEYLVISEIRHLGLLGSGPGFWRLTADIDHLAFSRRAYYLATVVLSMYLPYTLTDLTAGYKSAEQRAAERKAVIRYLEIWQDTVRGKISRNRAKLYKAYCHAGKHWPSDAWKRYVLRKQVLKIEQGAVQRRLRIVRTKGLAH